MPHIPNLGVTGSNPVGDAIVELLPKGEPVSQLRAKGLSQNKVAERLSISGAPVRRTFRKLDAGAIESAAVQ